MRVIKNIIVLGLIFSGMVSLADAKGLGKVMKSFLGKDTLSNYTKGGAYHDQASGYYTGGSLVTRTPVETMHFVNIQAPSLGMGCNGIDSFMGGFSFVRSDQLVQMGKSIVSNAAPYAAQLALKTMSPELASTLDTLQSYANEINQWNINSCQMAQNMLGGVWPRSEAASKEICQRTGTSGGMFSDWAAARHGCTTGGKRSSNAKDPGKGFEDTFGTEYNIAWQALMKNSFLASNKQKAELFMSVSGTITSREEGDRMRHQIWPSLALNNKLIEALMKGGREAEYYGCDNSSKCLILKKKKHMIQTSEGIEYYVRELTRSIREKLLHGTASLSPKERGFINSTQFPILKLIAISVIHSKNQDYVGVDSSDHIELIAHEILLNYLSGVIDTTLDGINQIRSAQLDDHDIKELINQMHKVKAAIKKERLGLFRRAEVMMSTVESLKRIEMRDSALMLSQELEGEL